jgi:penicillin-binding protein 2
LRSGPEKDIPKKFRDHAWFVAFAPVEAPTIAVAVIGEHMGHGGSASAPLAKELIETYVKLNISPTASSVKDGAVTRLGDSRGQGAR